MNIKYRAVLSAVLSALILASSHVCALSAQRDEAINTVSETKAYNWYCMHKKDGTQPQCEPEMSFITEHGGYYIDKKRGDLSSDDKVIYLTFDAGYENGNVEKILNVMKEENVTGAFFVLDNLIKRNSELVKRMADEGHLVCNHTAHHKDMTKITDEASFAAELIELENVCREYTGVTMAKYYRPPEGRFSMQNLDHASSLGYKTVLWSFAYADWDNNKQLDPNKAIEKVMSCTHNGEVVLLHPTSATNAEIIGELIRRWKEMGFRFGTLDELVADM